MCIGWEKTLAVWLGDLSAALGITPAPGWERVEVCDVCEDSRLVRPGALFVALPGALHDGALFIDAAIAAGAVAVVSDREQRVPVPLLRVDDTRVALARLAAAFHGRPTETLFAVGVTGTNGKTTVCHWIAHLLGPDRTVVIGTLANEAHGFDAMTTPSSIAVQQIAAEARVRRAEHLIVEASSIGLAQHRLDAVDFDVGVFTNLTRDHLDWHGSMEAYLASKRMLFDGLKRSACAVINADDPASDALVDHCGAERFRYGVVEASDLQGAELCIGRRGTDCSLVWRTERIPARIPHPGRHNLFNGLAAASVALLHGVPLDVVSDRLGSVPPVAGRCEVFKRADGVIGIVDFAHTPDALQRMLEIVRPPAGQLFVVFGCPGQSDRGKRPMMGEIAGRFADWTVLTADNPKHEDPEVILSEIEAGLRSQSDLWERVLDRAEAIRRAIDRAKPGDAILIAGKGHESYQIVGDRFVPYSDRDVLRGLGFEEADAAHL